MNEASSVWGMLFQIGTSFSALLGRTPRDCFRNRRPVGCMVKESVCIQSQVFRTRKHSLFQRWVEWKNPLLSALMNIAIAHFWELEGRNTYLWQLLTSSIRAVREVQQASPPLQTSTSLQASFSSCMLFYPLTNVMDATIASHQIALTIQAKAASTPSCHDSPSLTSLFPSLPSTKAG